MGENDFSITGKVSKLTLTMLHVLLDLQHILRVQ